MSRKSYKPNKKSSNNKENFKPSSSRRGKRVTEEDAKELVNKRLNDVDWYFTSKELAEQTSQLSFQSVIGLGGIQNYQVPSILRIDLNPCPGVTEKGISYVGNLADGSVAIPLSMSSQKSGINLMCSKQYTLLGTFTGRISAYAPQDVGTMELAISSVAELSEHIRRMFGLALTYNGRNRSIPLGLLYSMNIDVNDFVRNIAVYRMRFNTLMSRINQIPLLDNIGYIRKARDIYQRVYTDSESSMAQMFYYAPSTVWEMDETLMDKGTVLVPVDIVRGSRKTVSALLDKLDSMITKLLESSTLNLVYADILNMANKVKTPTWQFDYLAENYVVMPIYNKNALLQLHNLRLMGEPLQGGNWLPTDPWKTTHLTFTGGHTSDYEITFTEGNYVIPDVDNNNLVFNPVFPNWNYTQNIVDMDTPNPTVEDRIEALRYTSSPSWYYMNGSDINGSADTAKYNMLPALTDHYGVRMVMFGNASATSAGNTFEFSDTYRASIGTDGATRMIANLSQLDWAPLIGIIDTNLPLTATAIFGDLNFYTTFGWEYLSRLNDLIYVGLFDFRV